jgi:class 3 adenylate cyclase/alpha-beta hydrolase superfamily lysophospholipase
VRPETKYARRQGGGYVAYQVFGSGTIDLVLCQGYGHVELVWEEPRFADFYNVLGRFARVIAFDKLGTGLSDPVSLASPPTFDEWMDDVRAVMDAAGSDKAALAAYFEGGPMAILFAATYPDRVTSLALLDTYARLSRDEDYPFGFPHGTIEAFIDGMPSRWTTGGTLDWLAPSLSHDDDMRRFIARYERLSASPGTFSALAKMNTGVDVRNVLPSVQAPTLVIARKDNVWVRSEHGRYIADHIPGARFLELPGVDTIPFGEQGKRIAAEFEEFFVGYRSGPSPERALATVLFTDIVDSTAAVARLGDARWSDVRGEHDRIVRSQILEFRGREVRTTGDGFLATFDGPARAIQCAHSVAHRVKSLSLDVRAGLHTGECEIYGDDVTGIAVHIARRVAEAAGPGEVLVSRTVRDLVAGSGIAFGERGTRALEGVPEPWELFVVER